MKLILLCPIDHEAVLHMVNTLPLYKVPEAPRVPVIRVSAFTAEYPVYHSLIHKTLLTFCVKNPVPTFNEKRQSPSPLPRTKGTEMNESSLKG